MAEFHKVLKDLRQEKGFSQQELSDEMGISKSAINMYERGERRPNYETLELIADYFNVDMNYLLGRTERTTKIPEPTTIAAHFEGEEFTDEEMDEIRKYIEFVKSRRKSQKLDS